MSSKLQQLRTMTSVVADTGDIKAIKLHKPDDATTNPSLLLKAASLPEYTSYIDEAISHGASCPGTAQQKAVAACDYLAVRIGKEISMVVPGYVSTEVDARLSFSTQDTIDKAHHLIDLYKSVGVPKERILIKIASTWEGIRAAEVLQKEGINCNLTLLFSFCQAVACAEAGAFLISPFVGRIYDWYKKAWGKDHIEPQEDPGVQSVSNIYRYYKQHGYNTIVMGASFRTTGQIIALAGCDKLTISPDLLAELDDDQSALDRALDYTGESSPPPAPITEAQFRWELNEDAMATEKLAEGIRKFAEDQVKLENMMLSRLG
ncbi:transaldolase [Hahella sp. CCB-MM4]|uniref:transaldolase n=1 Tax=Hahella sp. (strain CCB-MM4) TaxID=1926491 RepID=UPI000B9BEAB6|nr:transaldolase [Hahella sp. CCB-MM4]OZG73684.1 transaldolase [Hahella sp. CCB-MM4]